MDRLGWVACFFRLPAVSAQPVWPACDVGLACLVCLGRRTSLPGPACNRQAQAGRQA